jgi:predicted lipoprotein with Yx(FWY)xxD motif
MRKILLTVLAGSALTLVACGSNKSAASDPYAAPPPAATTTTPSTATTIAVKTATTPLGQILVSPTGRTLYAFTKDTNAMSSCTAACAATWPPVLVTGDVTVDGNLSGSLFSVISRPDGTKQLEAGKWPLYTFSGDVAPGDTSGQGSGGYWFVVGAQANLVKG